MGRVDAAQRKKAEVPPHPATLREGRTAQAKDAGPQLAPHPATIFLQRASHPAITVLQRREIVFGPSERPPHAATLAPRTTENTGEERTLTAQRAQALNVAPAFPAAEDRISQAYDAADLYTTLTYLEQSIAECAEAAKNAINKGKAEIHFTCSIKKTSVVDTIYRCRVQAEHVGSVMTQGLAWYDPKGPQAGNNKYGPHVTFKSPGKETDAGKIPDVYHHVYFKFGETNEVK
jgi:hypothetical protein